MMVTCFLVFSFLTAHTYNDPWWAEDKAKHLATAYVLTKSATHFGMKKSQTLGVVVSLSLAKEIYDLKVKKTFFSIKDLFYDIAGITLGLLL